MAAVSTSAPFPAPLFSDRRLQAKKLTQGRGSSWDVQLHGSAVHPLISSRKLAERQTLVYAVNQDAEKSFKRTLEVDRLIDTLRDSNTREEKIESATDVLKAILKPVVDDQVELSWPPRDPKALVLLNEVSAPIQNLSTETGLFRLEADRKDCFQSLLFGSTNETDNETLF